ncbi:GSCOCG00010897001-RA-CDS [Cotesia congregata]|nr:GSCOCG00010897001-RA-CDS [Cotesia congregata]
MVLSCFSGLCRLLLRLLSECLISPALVLWIFSTVLRTCSSGTSCFIRRRISAYFAFSVSRMMRASGLIHFRSFFRLGSGRGFFVICFESISFFCRFSSFLD